jgi:hypothetical protein
MGQIYDLLMSKRIITPYKIYAPQNPTDARKLFLPGIVDIKFTKMIDIVKELASPWRIFFKNRREGKEAM